MKKKKEKMSKVEDNNNLNEVKGEIDELMQFIDNDPIAAVEAKDIYGNTLIHHSCRDNKYFCVVEKLLTLSNININVKNDDGRTPLHVACARNQKSTASYLIKRGAAMNEVRHIHSKKYVL